MHDQPLPEFNLEVCVPAQFWFDATQQTARWDEIPPDFEPCVEGYRHYQSQREHLLSLAKMAPECGWIETGRVKGRTFRQAWWRGKFEGGKKTRYIGKVGSPEYWAAVAARDARRKLKKLNKQIPLL